MTDPDAYLDGTNVLQFTGTSRLDRPVSAVINEALKDDLSDVIVIGRDKDGKMYFSSSIADGGDVLWLLEQGKLDLLLEGRR